VDLVKQLLDFSRGFGTGNSSSGENNNDKNNNNNNTLQ
jgi:hypothetical protein